MKVKLFSCYSYTDLEKEINNFIINKNIFDIKYTFSNEKTRIYTAMVIYDENVNKNINDRPINFI